MSASSAANPWNRALSWKLVFRITPHLPALLLEPLHHATTLLCFLTMARQRRAACRNLARVTGRRGLAAGLDGYRLFLAFSRVMVAHARLREGGERLRSALSGEEEVARLMEELLAEGHGLIIATAHVGHWDAGLRLLSDLGRPVHVVMRHEGDPRAERFAQELREERGLVVHQLGESPLLVLDLLAALRAGAIVTVQADRPAGSRVVQVPFFGRPAPLPTGPVQLAMASSAPLLPVFTLLDGRRRLRLLAGEPLRPRRARGPGSEGAVLAATRELAERIEAVVREHPHQWFNFHDVWPSERSTPAAP